MNRYFALILIILVSCQKDNGHKDLKQPNVLFIAFDDLNDWVGCLQGHPQAFTPNIDRLAAKGVLFTNAHANATMCCPSRASIMSGLSPSTTGIYKNTDTPLSLYKEKTLINKHFKDNSYYVAGAGKILHKFHYEADQWDEFAAKPTGEDIIGNRENPSGDTIGFVNANLSWGAFEAPDSLTFDGATVDWVADKLDTNHDKPFFLACGIFRPHTPWFNPQKYFDQFDSPNIALPPYMSFDLYDIPTQGQHITNSTSNYTLDSDLHNRANADHQKILKDSLWQSAISAYLASATYADAQLGRLLDALENSSYAENTIIILWSDHGWHLGEKNHWRKGTLWEEVSRVPLIIYDPKQKGPKICEQAVSLIDIYPTLIEMCSLPSVEGLEGESLVPLLKNPNIEREKPVLTSLTPEYHSIRDKRFRYTYYAEHEEELYDHEHDPNEWENKAVEPEYSQIIERLRAYLPQDPKDHVKGKYNRKNEK